MRWYTRYFGNLFFFKYFYKRRPDKPEVKYVHIIVINKVLIFKNWEVRSQIPHTKKSGKYSNWISTDLRNYLHFNVFFYDY